MKFELCNSRIKGKISRMPVTSRMEASDVSTHNSTRIARPRRPRAKKNLAMRLIKIPAQRTNRYFFAVITLRTKRNRELNA